MAFLRNTMIVWILIVVGIALVAQTQSDQVIEYRELPTEYYKASNSGEIENEDVETVTTYYKGQWTCDEPDNFRTCRQGIPKLFGDMELEKMEDEDFCPAMIFKKFLNCNQRFVAHCVSSDQRQTYWLYTVFSHMTSRAADIYCNESGHYYKTRYLEHSSCMGDMEDVHKTCKLKSLMRIHYLAVSSYPNRTVGIIRSACRSFRRFLACVHEKVNVKCGEDMGSYAVQLYSEIFFKINGVCQKTLQHPGKETNYDKKNENLIVL